MAKYISYSLWGADALYNGGAIANALQAGKIYPGWKIVFYYDNTVPRETIAAISDLGAKTIDMSGSALYGEFWRFLASDFDDCEYAIFRDTDSRLSAREKSAVDEWISDGKIIHVMRDHPAHTIPHGADRMAIMAGMWGIKGGVINMEETITLAVQNKNAHKYGSDQAFLVGIYDRFKNSMTVHDEFNDGKPFPAKREGFRFVGERIGTDEEPYGEDWKVIRNYYHQKKLRVRIANRIRSLFLKSST